MRSPSTALSPPSKRRCGLTRLVFNILYLREFSTEGYFNNNNKNNNNIYNNNTLSCFTYEFVAVYKCQDRHCETSCLWVVVMYSRHVCVCVFVQMGQDWRPLNV